MANDRVEISIIAPMYNEAAVIDRFFEQIQYYLAQITQSYEIICVNDGSTDQTWQKLVTYNQQDSRIKLINLSRNFGKEAALTAGIDHSTGQSVIPIDCDLQDPPELIIEMYQKWQEGFDVVLAKRIDRQSDSFIKRLTSKIFYSTMERVSDIDIPNDVGDFRLLDRKVINCLKQFQEKNRFMKGIFASLGFTTCTVEYTRPERVAGETKWNYLSLYRLAIDGIVSFSSFPLKLWSYIGASISLMAFLYGFFIMIKTLILGVDVPGYASLMVVILFMSGLILLCLGMIGEYLARVFIEVKDRPVYLVMEKKGFLSTRDAP